MGMLKMGFKYRWLPSWQESSMRRNVCIPVLPVVSDIIGNTTLIDTLLQSIQKTTKTIDLLHAD